MAAGRQKRKMMGEINVVPYIDVMLVLLIIFMVTAPLLTQGIEAEAVVEAAQGHQAGINVITAELLQPPIELRAGSAAEQIGLIEHMAGRRLRREVDNAGGPGCCWKCQGGKQQRCTEQCCRQTRANHVPHGCSRMVQHSLPSARQAVAVEDGHHINNHAGTFAVHGQSLAEGG
jgi:hypothetical protein